MQHWKLPIDRVPTEHEEQRELVRWVRQTYGVLIFAIPNGGERKKSQAARLKVEGVVRGVPDLFIPEWNVWVEMKRQSGGRLSKEQKDIHKQLEACGHTVIVGYGSEDAKAKISELGMSVPGI